MAALLKNEKLPHLSSGLTNRHKILHDSAHWPTTLYPPTTFRILIIRNGRRSSAAWRLL